MGILELLLGNSSTNSSNNKFKKGDKVRVKYRGQEGHIIDKNGSLYMVSINNGQIVDSYSESDIEKS